MDYHAIQCRYPELAGQVAVVAGAGRGIVDAIARAFSRSSRTWLSPSLASNEASYIVGQTIYVDGGVTSQLSPPPYQI